MHTAKHLTGESAAARVYRVLRSRPNELVRGPELARAAAVDPEWPLDAVSTRVAEVRKHPELPKGETVPPAIRMGNAFYYRLLVESKTGDLLLC